MAWHRMAWDVCEGSCFRFQFQFHVLETCVYILHMVTYNGCHCIRSKNHIIACEHFSENSKSLANMHARQTHHAWIAEIKLITATCYD